MASIAAKENITGCPMGRVVYPLHVPAYHGLYHGRYRPAPAFTDTHTHTHTHTQKFEIKHPSSHQIRVYLWSYSETQTLRWYSPIQPGVRHHSVFTLQSFYREQYRRIGLNAHHIGLDTVACANLTTNLCIPFLYVPLQSLC